MGWKARPSEREREREEVTVRGEDLTFSANWTATASRQTDRLLSLTGEIDEFLVVRQCAKYVVASFSRYAAFTPQENTRSRGTSDAVTKTSIL